MRVNPEVLGGASTARLSVPTSRTSRTPSRSSCGKWLCSVFDGLMYGLYIHWFCAHMRALYIVGFAFDSAIHSCFYWVAAIKTHPARNDHLLCAQT